MEKIKKWRRFALALFSLLFVGILSFALVQIIPARAVETYDTDGDGVCDGNTADYTIEADNNFTYDAETNTWASSSADGARLYDAQFTLTVTKGGNIQFQYTGSSAGGKNLSIYKTSTDGDLIFSKNYSSSVQSEETDLYTLVTDNKGKVPFIVTLLNVNEGVYIFQAKCFAQNYNLSGFKKATTNYNVSATIAGDVHGTVSIGDNTLNTDTVTGSTQVEMGKTITLTASPEAGYFAFWQDAAGKVVCRENAFTTPLIQEETAYTVRFEKFIGAGKDGQAKITYDTTPDEKADFGWKKSDTEGRYELTDISSFATSPNVHTPSSVGILTLTITFDGPKVISFDYLLERAMKNENGGDNGAGQLLRLYFVVDGDGVTTNSANADPTGKEEFWVEPYNYQVKEKNSGLKETAAVTMQPGTGTTAAMKAVIAGDGAHKVELVIVSVLTQGVPFFKDVTKCYVENIQIVDPTPHTFTLDYDEDLGDIAILGADHAEGNTYTGYDGIPITLTATAKKSITSSLDGTKKVNAHFIDWTAGDERSEATTCSLKFEDGILYFNGNAVEGTELSALFEEDVVAPTIWTKINDSLEAGDAAQQITQDKTEISVVFSTAEQKSLFVLFGGYEGDETIEFTVNGEKANAMSVAKNGELGPVDGVLTDEMKQTFATDTVNWWLAQQLGTQYEIKLTISKEGYFGTAEAVIYVAYTGEAIAAKQPDGLPEGANFAKDDSGKNDIKSVFNHLFTEEGDAGAYFSDTSADTWSLTSEFDGGETKSAVFEGQYDQSKLGRMSSGGLSSVDWHGSTLAIRNYYYIGGASSAEYQYFNYQGVLTFDIYLEVTKGAGGAKRDAVIMVERRDAYFSTDGVSHHSGAGVIEETTTKYSDDVSTTSNKDVIGLLDHKSKVSIWTGDSGGVNSFVTALGDGWYRCVIPTVRESTYPSHDQKDLEQKDGKYVHKTSEFKLVFAFGEGVEGRYAIRNVSFRQGTEANFKFSVNDDTYQGNVTAQAGEELTIDQSTTLGFGSTVTLTATAPDGKKFYGWEVISGGKSSYLPSTSVENKTYTLRYMLIDPVEIKAWFGREDEFSARYEGKYYKTLNEAMKAAETSGGDVYLIHNTTIEESLIIPQNVRVIIPFDESGSFMGSASTGYPSQKRIAWASADLVNEYRYLTITLGENVQVTVYGGLYLGGVVNYADQGYQGHTSGAYSELILKKGSQIIVKSGGVFDVYGRVWGGEGATGADMGTIIAEKGGKIYEPFLILDFSGGSITLDLFMAQITPFKRYAMINIECPMTINYGAQLIGHATLYVAQFKEFYSLDQPFISDDTGKDTMIMLKDGASVTITYDPNKIVDKTNVTNCTELIGQTKLVFKGGARFSYMLFSALGLEVPTAGVYFSIPYNFDVELNGEQAQYETVTDFMIMPGASVKVGAGATLTLHANAWVYGGFNAPANAGSKSYPTAAQLEAAGYSKSGHLIIDGTLKIDKKWAFDEDRKPTAVGATAATFLGIVETSGQTGRIEIAADAILSGTIKDGTDNCQNYFAYTTTARVWDKAHTCFGDLKAGHTYTATSGDAFKLDTLKYTNAEGGDENQTLELSSNMVGSWMIEHDTHTFDWSQLTEEEKELNGAKYKELTRQCTELGCNDKEHHLLLKSGEGLSATYKGADFEKADLVELFKEHFGLTKGYEYFGVEAQITNGPLYNAGTYSNNVEFTLTNGVFLSGENGTASETLAFTIEKFNLSALNTSEITKALENAHFTYDGTAKTLDLTEALKTAFGSEVSFSTEWNNNTNAGTATVTITGTGDNFTGSTAPIEFSIAKATLTVDVVGKTKTYDGTAWENVEKAAQGTDFKIAADGGKIYNSDDLGLKLTVGEPSADVGDYTVTGEAFNANYTVTVTEGTYKITRAPLTVNIESKSHTYGETAAQLSYTLDGVQNNEEEAIKLLISLKSDGAEQWAGAKQYNITAWYSGSEIKNTLEAESDDVLKNYTVTVSGGENAYTVNPKSIEGATFTVTETYTYDKTEKKPTMSEIEVKWTGYSDTDHTGLSEQFGKFTVDSYQNNTDAGTAHLTVNATGNFTGTKTVDFTIGKRDISEAQIGKPADVTYNGASQKSKPVSVKVTAEGEIVLELTESDYTLSWSSTGGDDCINVGTVTVTVTAAENGNYTGKATTTYQIAKAKVTITADDKRSPQGQELLDLTATVAGLIGADTFQKGTDYTLSLPAEMNKDSEVKTYTITVTFLTAEKWTNYEVTPVNGSYQITVAAFADVQFDSTEKQYNGEAQTIEATLPHSDEGTYSVTYTYWKGAKDSGQSILANQVVDAGTYTIVAAVQFANNNGQTYTDSLSATLTISKVKVTVTFDAQSSTYGDAVKTEAELTYTMPEGVLQKDQDTFKAAIHPTTDAESKSAAGDNYKITTDNTPELTNYDVTIVDGKYTITARAVDVTVNKQTVTYNQKSQSAQSRNETDWSVTNLAGGDEATVLNVSLEATGTNAGSYDITATWSNNNYAVTFKGAGGLTVEEGNKVKNAFVIEAAELTDATVTGSYTYNGQDQTPTFNVKAGDLTVAGSDFELEFAADADRVNAGTVNVTVKANGSNYKGSLEKSFTIAAKKIKVTLNAQTADYSGEVPTPDNMAYTVNDSELCSQNGVKDDLGVVITLVKGDKNVGSYGLDATASNENYEVEFDKTAQFTVTKKQITVKADDLNSFYGDDLKELTYTAEGLVEGEDAKTVLSITLEPERTIKEVGAYTIRGTGSAENYAFDKVEEGTYTVEKREVTVTINDQSSLYDGTEPEVVQGQGDGWTVPDGSIIAGDNLFIVLKKAEGADAAEYAISGAFKNDNYNVTFKGTMGEAGKFTIRARQLTVEIHDQSETYDHEKAQKQYGKKYKFDGGAWSIVLSSGDGLADGETREMLEISLHVAGTLSNAGKYAIAGECGNTNYAVTFTGNYGEDGEYKGTAGLYTIEKLDVSEEAAFMLSVKDGSDIKTEEGGAVVRVKFAGKAIELVCETTLLMGEDSVELKTKLSRESIGADEGIGSYEITVTIDDVNYCGQAVITVIVTDANGYTQRLKDVLAQLGELTAELDKEHLKAEDYTVLLEVVKALGSLDEEERKVGAEELAKYEEYVTAWEELADIGEVIETAKTVANAPIAALFEAAATLTALAGLAYIAFKGGML